MFQNGNMFQNALKTKNKLMAALTTGAFLSLALGPSPTQAQQFKVEKIKGNKAVIEYSGATLSPGATYSIGGASDSDDGASAGRRKQVIGGSLSLEYFTNTNSLSSSSTKDNEMSLLARFGWNLETYEIGFIAGYINNESDTSSYAAIAGGGFLDFNFTPNRPGENSILGAGAEATYTSITSSSGGSGMDLFASGFLKWFGLGPSTALRLDVGYNYDKGTYSNYSTTSQGFEIRGGIASYF